MDAAHLQDSQVKTARTSARRRTPARAAFCRILAQVKSARILVSLRLYPAELETEAGDPHPGSLRRDIRRA